jgi:hypothetical protein
MAEGTISARKDSHLSDTPLLLDEKGWKDLNKVLAGAVKQAGEIQKEAAGRLEDKSEGVSTKLAIMHFEVPAAAPKKSKAKAKR